MNGTSGFEEVQSSTPDHQQIGSWTSNSINSEQVPGTFSLLTISSISPQKLAQSKKWFLTPFACFTLLGLLSVSFTWLPAFAQQMDTTSERTTSPFVGKSCKEDSLDLRIFRWTQEEGPWCWATTAAIVMAFQGTTYAPCFVVDAVLRAKGELDDGIDCCDKVVRSSFENGCLRAGKAGDAFRSFQFDYAYRPTDESNGPMTFTEVTEELCNDRPFISKLLSPASTLAHTAVVYGYTVDPAGTKQLIVHDPQDDTPEPWFVPYEYFFVSNPYYAHIADYISICDLNNGSCPAP